jgi:hypothetical protein
LWHTSLAPATPFTPFWSLSRPLQTPSQPHLAHLAHLSPLIHLRLPPAHILSDPYATPPPPLLYHLFTFYLPFVHWSPLFVHCTCLTSLPLTLPNHRNIVTSTSSFLLLPTFSLSLSTTLPAPYKLGSEPLLEPTIKSSHSYPLISLVHSPLLIHKSPTSSHICLSSHHSAPLLLHTLIS